MTLICVVRANGAIDALNNGDGIVVDDAVRNVLILEDRTVSAAEPKRSLVIKRQVDPRTGTKPPMSNSYENKVQ